MLNQGELAGLMLRPESLGKSARGREGGTKERRVRGAGVTG